MNEKNGNDIAGEEYWSSAWEANSFPPHIDPLDQSQKNRSTRHLHAAFETAFKAHGLKGGRLLEIGCARSAWLPYFAEFQGSFVSGLDYSKIGCDQAKQILSREQIEGEIIHADMFSPPYAMIGAYDCVVSFGVVEHFKDTKNSVAAIAQFIRPGGIIITIVPNMTGVIGWMQKIVDRSIYDIHVPITREELDAAHSAAGVQKVESYYLTLLNLGICNVNGHVFHSLAWWVSKLFLKSCSFVLWPIIRMERREDGRSESRIFSSTVLCIGRK
jgi:SAM-dependent methyltransferase